MSFRRRMLIACSLGVAATLYTVFALWRVDFWWGNDLSWPLVGARELLAGRNPYASVAPYTWLAPAFPEYWPLYYPLPALLLVLPLALLPLWLGAALFTGASIGILAWALLRYRPHLLPVLLSTPLLFALRNSQWAPLTVAACLLGWWPLLLCKPTIGLPLLLERRPTTRRGWLLLAVGVGLAAASVPLGWLANTRNHPSVIPLLTPAGIAVALTLIAWRDHRSWLLVALALMPQRSGVDQLALGLLWKTQRGALVWTIATWIVTLAVTQLALPQPVDMLLLYGAAAIGLLADIVAGRQRDAKVQQMAQPAPPSPS